MATSLRAVLVDIDGTLLDSNDAHTRSWQHALSRQGHDRPHEAVRPLIGKKGGEKVLVDLFGSQAGTINKDKLNRDRGDWLFQHELHGLRPTLGARELLEKLQGVGLKVIVATSAQASETAALLRQAGLDDLIDDAADSGDADASKPDPDVVQSALRKADVRPSEAVMLGDTPYDVEAARRAGVPVVVLRCGGWWNDDAFTGATAIYDDPADCSVRSRDRRSHHVDSGCGVGQRKDVYAVFAPAMGLSALPQLILALTQSDDPGAAVSARRVREEDRCL